MKILHLPTAVGNHGYSLAAAERQAGYDSTSLVVGDNPLRMKTDLSVSLSTNKLLSILQRSRIIKNILGKYDVFHFNFSSTVLDFPSRGLNYLDLPLYRGAKFVTCNGSDVRQAVSKECNPFTPFPLTNEGYSSKDLNKKRRIEKLFKYIDFGFVQNPDLMRFLPSDKASFIPYIKHSWYEIETDKVIRNKKSFVIAHAPTNRFLKGSEYIIAAVEKLKESYNVDFRLIENMSHSDAKLAYSEADLLIDQVRLGWYGGVAVEAMRKGIPVAVYINPKDLDYVPSLMRKDLSDSFLSIDPTNIYEKLAELLDSDFKYKSLREAAISYVNQHHDPEKIIVEVITKYKEYL